MTPEQQAAQQARGEELKKWRLSVSMDKYKALRKMYNDAGVNIYAFKLEPNPNMSDEEYEYIFHVADTLGSNHVLVVNMMTGWDRTAIRFGWQPDGFG